MWNEKKLARFNAAMQAWRYTSDYDPIRGTGLGVGKKVFVDGTTPHCIDVWDPGILAATCPLYFDNTGFFRMYSANIYLNTTSTGHPKWNWNDEANTDPDVIDAQGLLIHEIGHHARMFHIAGACRSGVERETMCATPGDPGPMYLEHDIGGP